MKFNIWTFLFQIINFIVLLFILKRLLYRPVRQILEKRRDLIRKSMEEAERVKSEARELKERHEQELRELDEQKVRMLDEMREEALEEKKRLMLEAEKEAGTRVEKAMALFEVEKSGFERGLRDRAVETVRLFSLNILGDVADEELHRSLWRRFLAELGTIAEEIAGRGAREETMEIGLVSAYPTTEDEIDGLCRLLEGRLGKTVTISAEVDSALIAGVRLKTRYTVYDSSLAGQVEAFGSRLKGD
ncbi:MAG TPA: F0F1 ATP synthase subunit delta [Geobacteraceae bacterium]